MMTIDRNSPIPYYFQLKQILLEKIKNREWKPGDLIPSEHALEDQYQVSRTTIRQTLSELVVEGILVRERGRGTFVAQPKITYDPARRLDLNEYMMQQGVKLGWKLVSREWVDTPPNVREILNIAPEHNILRLTRLRTAAFDVIGYHVAYIPRVNFMYVDESQFCEGESLTYLHSHPHIANPRVERTLEASLADGLDLEYLDVKRNSPIFQIERLVLGGNEKPIEFMVARFRADRFKYRVTT